MDHCIYGLYFPRRIILLFVSLNCVFQMIFVFKSYIYWVKFVPNWLTHSLCPTAIWLHDLYAYGWPLTLGNVKQQQFSPLGPWPPRSLGHLLKFPWCIGCEWARGHFFFNKLCQIYTHEPFNIHILVTPKGRISLLKNWTNIGSDFNFFMF